VVEPVNLLGVKISPVGIEEAIEEIIKSIPKRSGDFFCFVNTHTVMEGYRNPEIANIFDKATANFPDGMGVVWALKTLGHKFKGRVRGTDITLALCSYASKNNLKIFLYGNTEETLLALKEKLITLFPEIHIAGMISPPFRELTEEEDEKIIIEINETDPDILFVSLGAPKQEKWMASHKGKIKAIQLGVGAAFDFITGKVKPAPIWMQKAGLEWLYRLPQQPIKTTKRMLLAPEFIYQVIKNKLKVF